MSTSSVRCIDWEVANKQLDLPFLTAMSNKDIEGAMSCFLASPDLVAVLWGKEFRGPEQLRHAILALFNANDEIAMSIDRIQEFRSGDAVLAVRPATYTFNKAGQGTKLTEVWTDVRRKVNGQWVYCHTTIEMSLFVFHGAPEKSVEFLCERPSLQG